MLGGTFNPVHYAHLFTAEHAAARLRLDRVLLVPAHQSPLKATAPVPAEHRVAMLRLAIADNPLLAVSTVDVERPAPSYTVETVALLAKQYQSAELFLILGIDALQDLLEWREPERLLDICPLIVVSRPGFELAIPPEVDQQLGPRAERITLLDMPLLEISSTDLRRRFAAAEPVRYLLPRAAEEYVRERGLYGASRSIGASPRRVRSREDRSAPHS